MASGKSLLRKIARLEATVAIARDDLETLRRETQWTDGEIRIGKHMARVKFRGTLHVLTAEVDPTTIMVHGESDDGLAQLGGE